LEEVKLDELFSLTYSFDPLKTLLRVLLDRLAATDKHVSSLKDLGDKIQRYSSIDKLVDSRLVFLEQLTTQQTKQLQELKQEAKKQEQTSKVSLEKIECKQPDFISDRTNDTERRLAREVDGRGEQKSLGLS